MISERVMLKRVAVRLRREMRKANAILNQRKVVRQLREDLKNLQADLTYQVDLELFKIPQVS